MWYSIIGMSKQFRGSTLLRLCFLFRRTLLIWCLLWCWRDLRFSRCCLYWVSWLLLWSLRWLCLYFLLDLFALFDWSFLWRCLLRGFRQFNSTKRFKMLSVIVGSTLLLDYPLLYALKRPYDQSILTAVIVLHFLRVFCGVFWVGNVVLHCHLAICIFTKLLDILAIDSVLKWPGIDDKEPL